MNIPFDLSGGALGVNRDLKRTILIKPIGQNGDYFGWIRITVTDARGEESMSMSEVIGDKEVDYWLRNVAAIATDGYEWHQLAEEPTITGRHEDEDRREDEDAVTE